VQSSSQIITTNKLTSSVFTGWMFFLTPNQQCQSTEGKNITFRGLAYPKLTRGSSNFVFDNSSSSFEDFAVIQNSSAIFLTTRLGSSSSVEVRR